MGDAGRELTDCSHAILQSELRLEFSPLREILKDEDIDAVYIATPVYLHVTQTVAAAEAGHHVLCEKPMAMNEPECTRMIDACAAHHVKCGVAYYRHFYPVVNRIKDLINAGEIGEVILVQINAFENFLSP